MNISGETGTGFLLYRHGENLWYYNYRGPVDSRCSCFRIQLQVFYLFGPHFDLYQSLTRLPIWNPQNCGIFTLAFVAGSLQGHWWDFISRNYVVWPIFFLMNVFIALKGTRFYRRDRASLNYSISILLVWRKMFKDERYAREKRVRNCFKYWSWIEQRWKESEVIRK